MKALSAFLILTMGMMITGCTRYPVHGEPLVLAGTKPARLLYADVSDLRMSSAYDQSASGAEAPRVYVEGKDYIVDRRAGTVARTPDSSIPDFSKNILYGQESFDHGKFPGYGNKPFTVYVDYSTPEKRIRVPSYETPCLPKTAAKLRAGQPLKIVAYGDSITAGGEASTVDLQYPARYVDHLKTRYPRAAITWENGATGGDRSAEGLVRLNDKVLTRSPDLVLLAFGMNDHNTGGWGVPLDQFDKNLRELVTRIRQGTGAEVILLSTFPPNPKWAVSSHSMDKYAATTARVADQMGCAYADVYGLWMKVLARKDPESMLANNINHPNDFGHWLYCEALKAIQF